MQGIDRDTACQNRPDRPDAPTVAESSCLRLRLVQGATLSMGLFAIVLLIRWSGTQDVEQVLITVAPVLVWLALLEAARIGTEVGATRAQLGRTARQVPLGALVKAHFMAHPVNTLAPAGRTACEALKAATLSPHLGRDVAVAMAVRLQAASLLAGATVSVSCGLAALGLADSGILAGSIFLHAAFGAGIGLLLFRGGIHRAIARTSPKKTKLAGRVKRALDSLPRTTGTAIGWHVAGRVLQVGQILILLGALGLFDTTKALALLGTMMLGTAAGDLIPGQLGATDSAFALSAPTIGIATADALAFGISLHIIQIGMAAVCAGLGLAWRASLRRQVPVDAPTEPQGVVLRGRF